MPISLTLHSSRQASIDALRRDDVSMAVQLAGIVGFALLATVGAQVRIYLWEVPITLQTLAVYGSGLFLGARNGFLSMLLYLVLGLFVPVFAGDGFGPTYLAGAVTAGYLLSYPVAGAVIGKLSASWNSLSGSVLALAVGSIVVFGLGVTWLHFAAGHATWFESLDKGWLRFVVFDLAKILCVGLVYSGTRRFF